MRKILSVALFLVLLLTPASSLASSETLRASPSRVQFGTRSLGVTDTRTVKVRNAGSETVVIFHVAFSAGFGVGSLTCFDFALQPGESCEIKVNFTPTTEGIQQGTMLVQYCFVSDPICPGAVFGQERFITIPLAGRGRL